MNSVDRVKAICKKRKIAISKIEKDLNYGNGYIGQLKKGTFPSDRLYQIAEYLNVSADYLEKGTTHGPGTNPLEDDTEVIENIYATVANKGDKNPATKSDGADNENSFIDQLMQAVPELTEQQAEFLLPQVLGLISAQKAQDAHK